MEVVVIGAFDRYNYGDNLMPIILERFLKKYYFTTYKKYSWVYAALIESDLSHYGAKKTIAMADALSKDKENVCAVISVGGEVLCASSSTLLLHMDHSLYFRRVVYFFKKIGLGFLSDIYSRRFYRLPWEYPYIPDTRRGQWKVGLNTVGGSLSKWSIGEYAYGVRKRLKSANYLSVRDERTKKAMQNFCSPVLAPDSVIAMSDLVTDGLMLDNSSDNIKEICQERYICFQAAPRKAGATAEDWSKVLSYLSKKYELKVILCPIGYAQGHDDFDFLKEVRRVSQEEFKLLDELNLWETMAIIRHSAIFMGTSLHGVITCLSFSVPYIGINPNVTKLDQFLLKWGVKGGNKCYSIEEIPKCFSRMLEVDRKKLSNHSKHLRELALENYHHMIQALELES